MRRLAFCVPMGVNRQLCGRGGTGRRTGPKTLTEPLRQVPRSREQLGVVRYLERGVVSLFNNSNRVSMTFATSLLRKIPKVCGPIGEPLAYALRQLADSYFFPLDAGLGFTSAASTIIAAGVSGVAR